LSKNFTHSTFFVGFQTILNLSRGLKYIYNVLVYEWVKDQVSNQVPRDRSGVIDVDIVD
jgi:hypothetical protein|tara:strand:+ start:96 stop:272 length:177 start_codon:yes stop_codon:yes gene_type:complete